jgi:hypothetical protein
MNKNKISRKKLFFNKQTIANLDGPSMNRVIAGILNTDEDCTGADTVHHPLCLAVNISVPECPPVESQEPGVVCPSEDPGCQPPSEVESCYPCVPTIA